MFCTAHLRAYYEIVVLDRVSITFLVQIDVDVNANKIRELYIFR